MQERKEEKESLKKVVVKNKDMESKRGLERERENKNKRTNMTAKGILTVLS